MKQLRLLLASLAITLIFTGISFAQSTSSDQGLTCYSPSFSGLCVIGGNVPQVTLGVRQGGPNSLRGPPSITESYILTVAQKYNSPAAYEPGFAQCAYDAGVRNGVDPAFMVAWAVKETSFGTAGIGAQGSDKNMFGMTLPTKGDPTVQFTSGGRFKKYSSYCDSVKDWNAYMMHQYFNKGLNTPEQIVPIYAPAGDGGNNPSEYISTVEHLASKFRIAASGSAPLSSFNA